MTSPKVDFLALLGVLEVTLILMVVALVFVIRSKNLVRQVRSLQDQLKAGETERLRVYTEKIMQF